MSSVERAMNVNVGWRRRTKTAYSKIHFLLLLSALFTWAQGSAQCTVTSTTGYTVVAHVVPIELVKPATCPWGYNYDVRLAYEIEFVGTGAPSSMYTLQGNLICGSQSLFFNLPNTGGSGVVTTTSNPWRGTSDCATSDIGSLSCFTVQLEISGPGISNRTTECGFSPLPVELISFGTQAVDGHVEISWSTATEQNSDRFVVERSQDGSYFEEIAAVAAAGNSSTYRNYTVLDGTPWFGNNYYRLRQWDMDGKQAESGISAVYMKDGAGPIKVFPNPGAGRELQLFGAAPGSSIALFSPTQALVYEGSIDGTSLSIPELGAGVFMGVVTSPKGQRSVFRYVRQ